MDKSDLAKRMKEYESVSKTKLIHRLPVVLRLDGKSFHSFTKNFKKPFDEILIKSMQDTMKYLCENIQGCVLGYTQSDEITLVLVNYEKLNSEPWFDYKVQKMCSIAASMCTMAFNKFFYKYYLESEVRNHVDFSTEEGRKMYLKMNKVYHDTYEKGAMFDCRAFNLPKEEVTNCLYWRQLDATRNSIQMVGQANFSHKELQNKSCDQIQDMLFTQKRINWNNLDVCLKRGSCCVKEKYLDGEYLKSKWVIDKSIPIFKGEGREYIDRFVYVGE